MNTDFFADALFHADQARYWRRLAADAMAAPQATFAVRAKFARVFLKHARRHAIRVRLIAARIECLLIEALEPRQLEIAP